MPKSGHHFERRWFFRCACGRGVSEPTVAQQRPNLSPLHSALLKVGAVGWHPLVPFRVGLMECIALH